MSGGGDGASTAYQTSGHISPAAGSKPINLAPSMQTQAQADAKHGPGVRKINHLIYVATQARIVFKSQQGKMESKESDEEACNLIKEGSYDVITLDGNDNLDIRDITQFIQTAKSPCLNVEISEGTKFVIKCNVCNYTFLTVDQFMVHNRGEDHKHQQMSNISSQSLLMT